jgi:hypothetical protein
VRTAHSSVGAALTVSAQLDHAGHAALATGIHNAVSTAFFHGFGVANFMTAGIAAAGAVMALVLLPAHPAASDQETHGSQVAGSPAACPATN